METINSVLLFASWLLCSIAENFLPEARPMISMLGPTRVSESSDTGLHDNPRFNVTGSYPPSQVIQLHQERPLPKRVEVLRNYLIDWPWSGRTSAARLPRLGP
jgi:hypothetical protein